MRKDIKDIKDIKTAVDGMASSLGQLVDEYIKNNKGLRGFNLEHIDKGLENANFNMNHDKIDEIKDSAVRQVFENGEAQRLAFTINRSDCGDYGQLIEECAIYEPLDDEDSDLNDLDGPSRTSSY